MIYKIAYIEYHNTLPFTFGFKNFADHIDIELQTFVPSQCAVQFQKGEVDIALVPVATLQDLKDFRVMSSYCIGSIDRVETVTILSKVPINTATTIHLDPHSRTSNTLIKLLCKEYWKINPEFASGPTDYDKTTQLVIGDKVFELKKQYPYHYDLSEAWYALTQLPFVFAVWVYRSDVPPHVIEEIELLFDKSFNAKHLWFDEDVKIDKEILKHYLSKNIHFIFDDNMKAGLDNFLSRIH